MNCFLQTNSLIIQPTMDDDKILALLEQNKAMIGERDPILESVHADLGRSTIDDDWQVRGRSTLQA